LRRENANHAVFDTKLFIGHDYEFDNITIELIPESLENCIKIFKDISKLTPIKPLKRKKIIQEIVGDLDIRESSSEDETII
jgi:hypothetical protein